MFEAGNFFESGNLIPAGNFLESGSFFAGGDLFERGNLIRTSNLIGPAATLHVLYRFAKLRKLGLRYHWGKRVLSQKTPSGRHTRDFQPHGGKRTMVIKVFKQAAVGVLLAAAPLSSAFSAERSSCGLYLPSAKSIVARMDDRLDSLVKKLHEQALSVRTRSHLRRAQRLEQDRRKLEEAWYRWDLTHGHLAADIGAAAGVAGPTFPTTWFDRTTGPLFFPLEAAEPTCGVPEPTCGLPGSGSPFGYSNEHRRFFREKNLLLGPAVNRDTHWHPLRPSRRSRSPTRRKRADRLDMPQHGHSASTSNGRLLERLSARPDSLQPDRSFRAPAAVYCRGCLVACRLPKY